MMERGYAHRVDIEARPGTVWAALTAREHLARWCSPRADVRPETGGFFRASVDRLTELEARIDVFEPQRRLRLMYLPSAALPPAESTLRDDFLLEPEAGATLVRLLGSGVPGTPEWDTQFNRLRAGWRAALNRLKVYVERQS